MRIVSIVKSLRGGKYKITFEDGEDLLLSKEVIVDHGLRRNDDLSEEMISAIRQEQRYHDAYLAAMRLLNYRMRTQKELGQRLAEKKFDGETVSRVIQKLLSLGLISDSRFAEAYVASKIASKPVGKRELERKLREKGLSKAAASEAIAEVGNEESQLELALLAAERKMHSLKRFEERKKKEKLVAFLARRGFEWSTIKAVVTKIFRDNEDVDL